MKNKKELISGILCLIYLIGITNIAQAGKSVFIISKHYNPSKAEAFSINSNQVDYQATIDIGTLNPGKGAVGNAVWPDKELMFVAYENSPKIVWASTTTLQKVGEFSIDVSGFNGAGIAIDEEKEKIYVIWRGYEDLYVYSFDDVNNTLILDGQYDLETESGYIDAWGLALDEDNDLLYVSDGTSTVHYYNTNYWSLEGSIDVEPNDVERNVTGIAVDPIRGYIYTGDWQDHNYLVRTMTSSPYTSTEVEITRDGYSSKELIGVDVDEDTGYIYCTTYHDDFRVYDSNLVLHDTETNSGISGPGGVVVWRLVVGIKSRYWISPKTTMTLIVFTL